MNNRTRGHYIGIATMAILLLAALAVASHYYPGHQKMLLAPMLGGLDSCLFEADRLAQRAPETSYAKLCGQDPSSPSQIIKATLDEISTNATGDTPYELGYTFYVPLLKLINVKDGKYELNEVAIQRVANTIANTQKHMVLYLFSNHFGSGSAVEDTLAKNPGNLLRTSNGPLPIDQYYGSNIYPWSFVQMDNEITKLRERAINAVLDAVCKLPPASQALVRGVTILGELHHMFPDFQGGMGFAGDYQITDYSEQSATDFRHFLVKKFTTIEKINAHLGAQYRTIDEITPPAKNIRKDKLAQYGEHIDAYAHGALPISGWVASRQAAASANDWVHIYQNGQFIARTPVAFGRQDVLHAYPQLPTSDVGWEYYFDFSKAPPGATQIDIYLEHGPDPLLHLGTRQVTIMDRTQVAPKTPSTTKLLQAAPPPAALLFSIDQPVNLSTYYYNPLVVLWHDFRHAQVAHYLAHFAGLAGGKCINPQRIYSHQILPFVNPGWDQSKFAVGKDLAVPGNMSLGVSLYGEASYGTSFFDWFSTTARRSYGVTEFHPLKAMDAGQLGDVLHRHSEKGAAFISFFMEGHGHDADPASKRNIFSFDPQNPNAGSDALYRSVQQILKQR